MLSVRDYGRNDDKIQRAPAQRHGSVYAQETYPARLQALGRGAAGYLLNFKFYLGKDRSKPRTGMTLGASVVLDFLEGEPTDLETFRLPTRAISS